MLGRLLYIAPASTAFVLHFGIEKYRLPWRRASDDTNCMLYAAVARQTVKTSLQHIIYDNFLKVQLILKVTNPIRPPAQSPENFTQNLNLNKIKDFNIFVNDCLIFKK